MNAGFALAIAMALGFAFTNGFHDAANAIATLVATRVARPGPAVLLASVFNLLGPLLLGSAVADTIASIVEVPSSDTIAVIGAGLTAAVAWNVFTWLRGLPSSSSHALVGGLVGAALVDAGSASAVNWGHFDGVHVNGVVGVLLALAISPVFGLVTAWALELGLLRVARRATVRARGTVRGSQWVTSSWLAFSHGSNDAQKTVGVIAALMLANGSISSVDAVPKGAVMVCAVFVTLGTALGGWRIVRTIGRRIFRVRPLDGLTSQASSSAVIMGASFLGAPVSTTQVVSSSVVGVGLGRKRYRHVGWLVVEQIAIAWVTTLPASALLAAVFLPVWRWIT